MTLTRFPQQIGGFEILGSLGQGGMGIVYCARDNTLQRELAIKLQSGDWKDHPEALERFLREARILAQINHPHVVQIYSVGEHEGAPFFVMELLHGSIEDAVRLKMPGIDQLKRWMLEAARGLAAIHEMGVVHRDIKPGNLLLTRPTSVEPEHVKVADLGIARAGAEFGAALTRVGVVFGTGGYVAPETFRRGHVLDARADQFSLGVVFFELLARRAPFEEIDLQEHSGGALSLADRLQARTAPDVREFRPEVDPETAAILARMLRDDPDERFPTTAALVQALVEVQGAPQPLPLPTPAPDVVGPSVRVSPPAPLSEQQTPPITARVPTRADRPLTSIWILALVVALIATTIAVAYWHQAATMGAPTDVAREAVPSAASAPTLEMVQRESRANYLIGHYWLKAPDGAEWTLDFIEQTSGVIAAELKGIGTETLELSGFVESYEETMVGSAKWKNYRVVLTGPGDIVAQLRIAFSGDATAGEGWIRYDGAQLDFVVEDSEELQGS